MQLSCLWGRNYTASRNTVDFEIANEMFIFLLYNRMIAASMDDFDMLLSVVEIQEQFTGC